MWRSHRSFMTFKTGTFASTDLRRWLSQAAATRGEEQSIPVWKILQGMSDMLHNTTRKSKAESREEVQIEDLRFQIKI